MKLQLSLNKKDVFRMFMYTYYCRPTILPMALITGYGCWLVGVSAKKGNTTIFAAGLFVALFFTVLQPILIWGRAKKQTKDNPLFAAPFSFGYDETGFCIEQNEHRVDCAWSNLKKVMISKKDLVLYPEKAYAYLIPLQQLRGEEAEVLELVRKNVPKQRTTNLPV